MKYVVTLSLEAIIHVKVEAENEEHAIEVAMINTEATKIDNLPTNIQIGYPEDVISVSEIH